MVPHLADRGLEIGRRAVVEVGCGLGDVLERRHFEDHAVARHVRHADSALVLLVRPRDHGADLLKHGSAHLRAGVARHASHVEEDAQPMLLVCGQRRRRAGEEAVPARRGDQAALEGSDGVADVLQRYGLSVTRERALKHGAVGRDRLQGGHDGLLVGHGHLDRIQDGAGRLLFDGAGAAVPELRDVHGRVVHAGGVATATLSVDAGRRLPAVDSEFGQRVAVIA
jgi:hypothetical protein